MNNQEHNGYVIFDDKSFGAKLYFSDEKIFLNVDVLETNVKDEVFPDQISLLNFQSSSGYFALCNLYFIRSQCRLDLGSTYTFRVLWAFENAHFKMQDDIRSDNWSVAIEDFNQIQKLSGFKSHYHKNGWLWGYTPPPTIELNCPHGNFILEIIERFELEYKRKPKQVVFNFSYPAKLYFDHKVHFDDALKTVLSIRKFFSLLMGRVLNIDGAYITLTDGDFQQQVNIYGFRKIQTSDKPLTPIIAFESPSELEKLLDRWFEKIDKMNEAITLHYQGLEQKDLVPELCFQLFMQAIEGLHRRTVPPSGKPADINHVVKILEQEKIAPEIVDKVEGILAYAHEPGLRQRLKYYWDLFSDEITALSPIFSKDKTIQKLVATRNYYAHRLDKITQVLTGKDLRNATELVKAISHMAILTEIGVNINGIGKTMKEKSFVNFIEPDKP